MKQNGQPVAQNMQESQKREKRLVGSFRASIIWVGTSRGAVGDETDKNQKRERERERARLARMRNKQKPMLKETNKARCKILERGNRKREKKKREKYIYIFDYDLAVIKVEIADIVDLCLYILVLVNCCCFF